MTALEYDGISRTIHYLETDSMKDKNSHHLSDILNTVQTKLVIIQLFD